MNSDQVSGKFDQVAGKVIWGNAKDAVHQNAEAHKLAAEKRANDARGNVVDSVDAAREHANAVIDNRR